MSATLVGMFPFLLKPYADGGYQGPTFRRALMKVLSRVNVEIVKRSDTARKFVVLPKRWIVERTFAWLSRYRRLSKDYEETISSSESWLWLAMSRLLLARPTDGVSL